MGTRADCVIGRLRAPGGNVLLFAHRELLRILAARWVCWVGLAPIEGRHLLLATASLSILGYDHDLTEPVIHALECQGRRWWTGSEKSAPMTRVLVLNTGSSSVKWTVLAADETVLAGGKRSGLRGVSGVSGDLMVLEAADKGSSRARLVCERFVLSIRRALGAMVGVLGGVDAVVFTGGMGDNSARVRRDVTCALRFARLELAEDGNPPSNADRDIAAPGSTRGLP